MAKALETVLADFKPSPLQQAAINRIHEYQDELKEYGMYVRSGIELEFMVEDRDSTLVTGVINLKQAEQFLKNPAQNLPYLERLGKDVSSEYEFTVGDPIGKRGKISPTQFSPVGVAANTALLKYDRLGKMLRETTCLNSEWVNRGLQFHPVFRAYPGTAASDRTLTQLANKTSGLHINVSLYDKQGNNLFAENPHLMEHSARSLVELQDAAGLAFLPKKNSLKRLYADKDHYAVPAGLGMEQIPNEATRKYYSSVNMRGGRSDLKTPTNDPHNSRIENRLPGADADPFVSMAITMAALVDAVRQNVEIKENKRKGGTSIHVDPVPRSPAPKYDIPRTHAGLVDNFVDPENRRHLNDLLGPELYRAILAKYAKDHPVALSH